MELNSFNREIYETLFEAFVSSARSMTLAMQKDNKGVYDNNISCLIKSDELASFFNEVRTYSFHEGNSKIDFDRDGLRMRHRLNFDGKGGCVALIKSRNGEVIKEVVIKSDPNAEFFLGGIGVPYDSGLWERIYHFDCINNIDLPDREIVSVTDFCYEYLSKLGILVDTYNNLIN